jgi:hypothetical protein
VHNDVVSRPDPTPDDYKTRVETGAAEVETIRDQLQDAIDRRNADIVEAIEHHAGNVRQIAGWAQLSKPMIERILANT